MTAATATPRAIAEPTAEQRRAIELRDRDVFLEAGAGTGKTRVLVERYCDAVALDGVAPERILAFTFTDRAAAELRERVRAELVRRSGEARDDEIARALARAARDTERSWLTTIHGFCRRLLALHPAAAGLDPRFRVLDEAEAGRLADRAFEQALGELVESGHEGALRLATGYTPKALAAAITGAHARLRSQGADSPRLPDPGPPVRSRPAGEPEPDPLGAAEARAATLAIEGAAALLAGYSRRYEELKRARSGVDFEDLQLRALRLLRGTIGEVWGSRFTHLMVDEFQDTNRLQLALLDALRGPETRLFVVGDEFQSIYRFRHADLEVFRERRRTVEAHRSAERLLLRGNFRSGPEVLAAINFAGAALLDRFAPLAAGVEADHEPPGGAPSVELLLTDASGDDDRSTPSGWRAEDIHLEPPASEATPSSVAEARFLAERLRSLADDGVPRGEMVVLLRAFTHVDAFEEALARAGLDPYVVGGRGYWSQQQVEDALRLLAVIANPLDDEMLFGALASPACGARPDALWLLRGAAGEGHHVWPLIAERRWGEAVPAADANRLDAFRHRLLALRDEAPLLTLDSLIERALTAFDYDLAVLVKPGGRRRLANLRKLMRMARDYEINEGRDLRGFLEFAAGRTARDEREGQAAVRVEGHDGVRIMTVHAAKGLQFPVVAVADLGRPLCTSSWSGHLVVGRLAGPLGEGRTKLGLRLSIPAAGQLKLWDLAELEEEDRREDAEESCRLAYVAATRAERRLILSGIFKEKELEPAAPSPRDSALRRLLRRLNEAGWDRSHGELALPRARTVDGGPAQGPEPRIAIRVSRPSPARAAELRLRAAPQAPAAAPVAPGPPPPLLDERPVAAPVGHLSYSGLDLFARCSYRYYVERVIGLGALDPEEDEPRAGDELPEPGVSGRDPESPRHGLAIGGAVHAGLEWCARHEWRAPSEAEMRAILARAGLNADGGALATVREMVGAWLGSKLLARLRSGGYALRPEVPFALGLRGTVVRGAIDLLAERPGELLVVDYKTSALDGGDPAALAERYATQRDLYALAASARAERSGASAVGTAYSFLAAADRPVVETYDAARLTAARERLEALVAALGEAEFYPAERPYPALCFGCPAAARLCSRPAWTPR